METIPFVGKSFIRKARASILGKYCTIEAITAPSLTASILSTLPHQVSLLISEKTAYLSRHFVQPISELLPFDRGHSRSKKTRTTQTLLTVEARGLEGK